jgi:hypothetical protein
MAVLDRVVNRHVAFIVIHKLVSILTQEVEDRLRIAVVGAHAQGRSADPIFLVDLREPLFLLGVHDGRKAA